MMIFAQRRLRMIIKMKIGRNEPATCGSSENWKRQVNWVFSKLVDNSFYG